MKRPPSKSGRKSQKGSSDSESPVGYCNPPKHSQFKPGETGNKRGRPKKQDVAEELRTHLRNTLLRKVKITDGGRVRTVTQGEAGIEQLVRQFAKGDPRARRDLLALGNSLGLNFARGAEEPLATENSLDVAAILESYVQRRVSSSPGSTRREFAPSELLDEEDSSLESSQTDISSEEES